MLEITLFLRERIAYPYIIGDVKSYNTIKELLLLGYVTIQSLTVTKA
jgi:hypothetical protein